MGVRGSTRAQLSTIITYKQNYKNGRSWAIQISVLQLYVSCRPRPTDGANWNCNSPKGKEDDVQLRDSRISSYVKNGAFSPIQSYMNVRHSGHRGMTGGGSFIHRRWLPLMQSMSPYRAIYSNIKKNANLMLLGLPNRYAMKWSKSVF